MQLKTIKNSSIIIGNYINCCFEGDILLNFKKKDDMEYYFKRFLVEGYKYIANKYLNFDKGITIDLTNEKYIIGKAFKIENLENNVFNKNENINNNISENNINQTNNNNQNNLNQSQNQQIADVNKNKVKLHYFCEKQIKALISFYFFNEDLKLKISTSDNISLLNEINKNTECFLVDNNWMESYKKIFSYEKLIHQILKILKESKEIEKDKDKIEKIYEKLDNKYMDEINEKVKNHEETGNKECKKFAGFIDRLCGEKFYESSNIEDIIKYNNFKFNIFSENIYDYMNQSSEKILNGLTKKSYIINDKKIYIKLEDDKKEKNEILIANFNQKSDYFIPELLLKYYLKISMITDFDYLKYNDYKKFIKEQTSIIGNELIRKNTQDKIGIIYDLNNPNSINQLNQNFIKFRKLFINKLSNSQGNTKGNNSDFIKNTQNEKNFRDAENKNNNNDIQEKNFQNGKINNSKIKNGVNKGEEIINQRLSSENREILTYIKNNTNNINSNIQNSQKENQIVESNSLQQNNNKIDEKKLELDENTKYYVEFLIRLFCFDIKLSAKINYSNILESKKEKCYIINIFNIK